MKMITEVMEKATLSPAASRIWNQLENSGFENIPRKKAKFSNFISNSMRINDKKPIEEIWAIFEKAFNEQRKDQTPQKKTPKKEPMKVFFVIEFFKRFWISFQKVLKNFSKD